MAGGLWNEPKLFTIMVRTRQVLSYYSVKLVEWRIPVKQHGKHYIGEMRVPNRYWVDTTQCVLTLVSSDSSDL